MDYPIIPEKITVHLGAPDAQAENVTVSFPDYIKNVASSEIYPTWPETAIRANIYAQISIAMNRVYTEWYRSKGYDFDITNSTAFDQSFVNGRNIFENISRIVDEIFNSYLRREGFIEPLYATYCDGIQVTCDGMSQWGTVDRAREGLLPYQILRYYYGENTQIVSNVQVQSIMNSYPGAVLQIGSIGVSVERIQRQLNRISRNYPLIPKIQSVDGIFGADTRDAVIAFQSTFNLEPDGIVGKQTWYKIQYIYVAVKKLAQLDSEGLKYSDIQKQFTTALSFGDTGEPVQALQYYLKYVGIYNQALTPIEVTGTFDSATEQALRSFQTFYGLEPTGILNLNTINKLNQVYLGILEDLPYEITAERVVPFGGRNLGIGSTGDDVRQLQTYLSFLSDYYPTIPKVSVTGYYGTETQNAVIAFQNNFGITPRGIVGAVTWNAIEEVYEDVSAGAERSQGQFSGEVLNEE